MGRKREGIEKIKNKIKRGVVRMVTTGFLVCKRGDSVNIFAFEDSVFLLLKHFHIFNPFADKKNTPLSINMTWATGKNRNLNSAERGGGCGEGREPFLINN